MYFFEHTMNIASISDVVVNVLSPFVNTNIIVTIFAIGDIMFSL